MQGRDEGVIAMQGCEHCSPDAWCLSSDASTPMSIRSRSALSLRLPGQIDCLVRTDTGKYTPSVAGPKVGSKVNDIDHEKKAGEVQGKTMYSIV